MLNLKIERVENGYVLTYPDFDGEGKDIMSVNVIEDKEIDKDTMTILLEWIATYFGENYDKFKEDNLNIQWNKKGDKCN